MTGYYKKYNRKSTSNHWLQVRLRLMFLLAQIMKTKAYKTILLEKMFPISGCASTNFKTRVFSKVLRTMMTTVASKFGCCQKSFHLNFILGMNWRRSVTVYSVEMNFDASYLSCLVDEKYIRNLFEKILLQQKNLEKK